MFTSTKAADISPPTVPDDQGTLPIKNEDKGQLLGIDQLELSAKIQPRVALDEPTIEKFREMMAYGTVFDPVIAFRDGRNVYWLADGFHRVEAAKRCGFKEIAVEVKDGTYAEAELFACGANTRHGKPLTNEDKNKIVGRLICKRHRGQLVDSNGDRVSDRFISRLVGVSPTFVGNLQRKLFPEDGAVLDISSHGMPDTGQDATEAALEPRGTIKTVHSGHPEGKEEGVSASEREEEQSESASVREHAERRNGYPLDTSIAAVTEAPPPPTTGSPKLAVVRHRDTQAPGMAEALVAHVMEYFQAHREVGVETLASVFKQAVPVIEARIQELETAGA